MMFIKTLYLLCLLHYLVLIENSAHFSNFNIFPQERVHEKGYEDAGVENAV